METQQGFLLSRQQKRLYRQAQNLYAAMPTGEHSSDAIQNALQTLVAEHEILHTRFYQNDDMAEPLQQLAPAIDWGFDIIRHEERPAMPELTADQQLAARVWFDTTNNKTTLLLTLSAMIADKASINHIKTALASLLQQNAPLDSDEIVQYVDFAQWQDEVVEEDHSAATFWQQQKLDLRDYPLPSGQNPGDKVHAGLTNDSIQARLDGHFGESQLLAAWSVLLHRFCGDSQLWVDVASDCRGVNPDFAEAIGPYSLMLPCQIALNETQTAGQIQQQLASQLDLYRQSQLSFPPQAALHGGAVGFEYIANPLADCHVNQAMQGYKLNLVCQQQPNHCDIQLHFDQSVLPQGLADSMLKALQVLLNHWQPDQTIAHQRLVDEVADAAMVQGKDGQLFAENDNFVTRFAQSVKSSADSIALISHSHSAQKSLTYQQLDQASNRLVAMMKAQGLKPKQRVAFCLEHELALGMAIVAILKAGCSYIAIDGATPLGRMDAMLAKADFLLHGQSTQDNTLFAQWPGKKGLMDSDLSVLEVFSDAPHISNIAPVDVAYVLYTSGSTGQPKGVEISHGALLNYLHHSVTQYLPNAKGSVVHTPVSFDLTVTALLAPLCCGKFVSLVTDNQHLDGLKHVLTAHADDPLMLKLTPAHLKALNPWFATQTQNEFILETLVVGGEALFQQDIEVCREVWPKLNIVNEYGPTEATVGCAVYHCDAQPAVSGAVPIGLPINNTTLMVLDNNGQPLPYYCAGELYIAGVGLANGYLDEPEQTADKFKSLEVFKQPAGRHYKSGDQVLLTRDRGFEFLGRNDAQVKIRGYRIELGDVSAGLKSGLAVDDVFVVTHLNSFDENELVAYVQTDETISLAQMNRQMENLLPGYMLPVQLICLPTLPLTRNGKVNVNALPSPATAKVRQPYVAPTNDIEQHLVDSWQAVLEMTDIGINDNFFALGGDSIRVVHAVSMVNEHGYGLTAEVLFNHSTVAEVAQWIVQQQAQNGPALVQPSSGQPFDMLSDKDRAKLPDNVEDAYPLGMVQLGMMFHMNERRDANAPPDYHNVASYWLKFNHNFRLDYFQQAVDGVVAHEAILRTGFNITDFSEPLQLVYKQVDLPVIYQDLRGLDEAEKDPEVKRFIERENFNVFDMSQAPLQRYHVHQLENEMIVFSITEPHSISDGWSTHLTLIDLIKSYYALVEGSEYPLLPVQTGYGDFIRVERQVMQSDEAKAFWQQQLSRAVVTELPLREQHTPGGDFGEHRKWVELPEHVTEGLNAMVNRTGVPIKSVLLAAHCRLLSMLSGQKTVTTGLNFNGRLEVNGGTNVRGMFLNMLPVTLTLDGGSWLELVKQTHRAEVDILPYRRFPLGELQRQYGNKNLFDTAFHYLHFHSIKSGGILSDDRFECLDCIDHSKTNYDYNPVFMVDPIDSSKLSYVHDANLERFSVAQLDQFCAYYQLILEDIALNPEADYNRMDYLGEQQRQYLVETCNNTATDDDITVPVHRLIEQQAVQTPDALAIECAQTGKQLSYRQLNTQANKLAGHLQTCGIGAGKYVGLYLPRSIETLITVLAIVKTGAAYVPFDQATPIERVLDIVDDCQAAAIVAQGDAPAEYAGHWIDAESAIATAINNDSLSAANPGLDFDPQNPAYILFTSGSTGKPKGVMVPHSGLSNYLLWAKKQYRCQAGDCMPLYTSLAFDLTVTTLFMPLISGGSIRVFNAPDVATLLQDVVNCQQLNLIKLTPAHLTLLSSLDLSQWQVDRLIVGGEQLRSKVATDIGKQLPGAAIYNEYGPTEATVGCMVKRFDAQDEGQVVSIGKPAANVQIYLLDESLHPVPHGVKGQIYIAGSGLALGYLNDAAQTETSFIDNPFKPGKMYRSGDLAVRLHNGELAFISRIDSQTKLNGYRIELGEIEQKIDTVEGIEQSVMVIRQVGEDSQLVCYVLPQDSSGIDDPQVCQQYIGQLRSHLGTLLPSYMVPASFVFVAHFDLTVNGKVDRDKLPEPEQYQVQQNVYQAPRNEIEKTLCEIWQTLLDRSKIGINDNFFDIGGSSVLSFQLQVAVTEGSDYPLSVTDIFEYPTIAGLAEFIQQQLEQDPEPAAPAETVEAGDEPIAIIGLSGRFADADNVETFWQNLQQGHESLHWYDDETLLDAGVPEALVSDKNYVKAGAVLNNIKGFDAGYFDVTPRNAQMMDPQQRLLFECAVEALDDAGYGNAAKARPVGVFVGVGEGLYFLNNIAANQALVASQGMEVLFANSRDFAATRVSHTLNLTGPSVTVATACSTSLVGIHQACASLLENECEVALAGGAKVGQFDPQGYLYQEGGILSPDGHCRAFDANAAGTRGGDGAGLVVLKRLSRAEQDGDQVYAIIKGSAVNNDGNNKAGFTAPGVAGQVAVIGKALQKAGVDAQAIGYVETHGTGTLLGDPVEIRALNQAFKQYSSEPLQPGSVAIGSVKTNIGHLDAAAGVVGVIKTVLAMKNDKLPPSLNFDQANPAIDFAQGPFYVNDRLSDWPRADVAKVAAVSSFGIGGTNANVIIGQSPQTIASQPAQQNSQLICVSARSASALRQVKADLVAHLAKHPQLSLQDVAFTLQAGRTAHAYREAIVVDSLAAIGEAWQNDVGRVTEAVSNKPFNVMMFPGQGSQYLGAAQQLYREQPLFADYFAQCAVLFNDRIDFDLTDFVLAEPADEALKAKINQTRYAQPLLFSLSYALAKMLIDQGVEPDCMIGHSIGEYVAATLAQVMTLEQAVQIIAVRAELMQSAAPGNMVTVAMAAADLPTILQQTGAELAAINGPASCVLSVAVESLDGLLTHLGSLAIEHRVLQTSHAYHSSMMEPILAQFVATVSEVIEQQNFNSPKRPYISNLSGDYADAEQVVKADYWADHLRQSVQFDAGLSRILNDNIDKNMLLWEVGAGNSLSMLARKQPTARRGTVLATLPHANDSTDDASHYLNALARLWSLGGEPAPLGQARRVSLPSYPFERQTYWLEGDQTLIGSDSVEPDQALADDPQQCFYSQNWSIQSAAKLAKNDHDKKACWLVVADDSGLGDEIVCQLRHAGNPVVEVTSAASFEQLSDTAFAINFAEDEDYRKLVGRLAEQQLLPNRLVHCASLSAANTGFDQAQIHGVLGARHMLMALMTSNQVHQLQVSLVAANTCRVTGSESLRLDDSTLLGLAKIAPQEYPEIQSQFVDVGVADSTSFEHCAKAIIAEFTLANRPNMVALRQRQRWITQVRPIEDEPAQAAITLRKNGVYMITGGLGNIGLTLAHALATDYQAKLVLVGRSGQPANPEILHQIEQHADSVMVATADCSDLTQMSALVGQIQHQLGGIDGVIHAAGQVFGTSKGLAFTGAADFTTQHQAKVHGLQVLDQVLGEQLERTPDFCVVMSSLASILGGLGFTAYACANIYADAFVNHKHSIGQEHWLSINWDGWDFSDHNDGGDAGYSLTPAQGVKAFYHALSIAYGPQLINSSVAIKPRIEKWLNLHQPSESTQSLYARPQLSVAFEAPQTAVQQQLAGIWQHLLGIEQIGINDSFFELGGDSLLVTRVLTKVRHQFDVSEQDFSIHLFFEQPTIAQLAGHIESSQSDVELKKAQLAAAGVAVEEGEF